MATIQDVADKVGITKGVVSAYLNDPETTRVSAATKQKIDAAVAELGYVRNVHARSLSSRRSNLITVLVLFRESLFRNPGVNEILSGAADVLSSFDYGLVFPAQGSGSLLDMARRQIREHSGNDGYLLIGTRYATRTDITRTISELEDRGTPFVVTNMTELPMRLNQIVFNPNASAVAIRNLHNLGHRRILVLGGTGHDPRTDHDLALVRSTLEEYGIDEGEEYFRFGGYEFRPARDAVLQALDDGLDFTAIFALARHMAMGAGQALAERGVRVPEEVTISTFAESRFLDYYHFPYIVTERDYFRMGREGAGLLMSEIETRAAQAGYRPQTVRLDCRLVLNEAVASVPARKEAMDG